MKKKSGGRTRIGVSQAGGRGRWQPAGSSLSEEGAGQPGTPSSLQSCLQLDLGREASWLLSRLTRETITTYSEERKLETRLG
jgi:hypothetical protein